MEYVIGGLVLVVVGLVILVMSRPDTFRVERSTTVTANPEAVFTQINDFHNWPNWSPWDKLDPNMVVTHAGSPAGVGAEYSWVGNKKAGAGHMTILDSRPHEFIKIKLEFFKPFKVTNTTEFTIKPTGNQTSIQWVMYGKNNFMFKLFQMLMNMDKLVGGDFERGLAALKAKVEAKA